MILRRVIEHGKNQHWTAVALDFPLRGLNPSGPWLT